jgi:DNA-binding CsgD family transcriptional regulator
VEAVLDNENSIPIFGVPITKRELQIIRLFNKSDKEIAEILSVSISTVNFHKSNIYKKCAGKRKNEILSEAIGKGIIQPGELH